MYPYCTMREKAYDLMRGLGIILLLIGHAHIPMRVFTTIGLFFIPMFFLISGNFFRVKQGEGFAAYVGHKARRLMVPYLFFLAVSIIFHLLQAVLWHEPGTLMTEIGSILHRFAIGVTGDRASLCFLTIWFLVSLFEVSVLYWLMARIRSLRWRTVVSVVLLVVGYLLQATHITLPFLLSSMCTLQFYFHLGYVFRQKGLDKQEVPLWVSATCLAIIFVGFNQANALNEYCSNIFAPTSVPLAVIATWSIYHLMRHLARSRYAETGVVRLLNFIGVESLVIYGLHRNFYFIIDGVCRQLGLSEGLTTCIMVPLTLAICLALVGPLTHWVPRLIGK